LDEDRWNLVTDTLDLLSAKVEEIERNQHKEDTKTDVTSKIIDQLLKDQQLMAKQIENTGKTVAQLRLDFMNQTDHQPPSPTDSDTTQDNPFYTHVGNSSQYNTKSAYTPKSAGDRGHLRNFMPKMNFPKFSGKNPNIWKNKCEDYFKLLDIPESMWTTPASLHMEGNAETWTQVYKLKEGLGSW
jgi:hypothetical protein